MDIKKIIKNSAAIIIGSGVDALVALFISVLLAKHYGQSDFGKFSFLGIFYFFLGTVDGLWLKPLLVRGIIQNPGQASIWLGNGILIRVLVAIMALIFLLVAVAWVGISPDMYFLAVLAAANILLSPLVFSADVVFCAKLRMDLAAKIKIGANLFYLVLVLLVVRINAGLLFVFLAALATTVFSCWQSGFSSWKMIRPVFIIDPGVWKNVILRGWPLGLSAFFIFIYHRIDQAMLLRMCGTESVGLYAVSVRLVEWLQIIPAAVISTLLPAMTALATSNQGHFQRVYDICFKYLMIIIVPTAVIGGWYSQEIITGIYGQGYSSSSTSMAILLFAEVFVYLGIVNNVILVAANKQKWDPVFTGCAVVVNLVLNMTLIPKYGINGAAIASLCSYATGPVAGLLIRETKEYSQSMCKNLVRPVTVGIIIHTALLCSMPDIKIILAAYILIIAGVVLRVEMKEDLKLIKGCARIGR